MVLRSLMFVPANRERYVRSAFNAGADAIILDLEDSIGESDKILARNALAEAVPFLAESGAMIFVRVNSEPRLAQDIEAAIAAGAKGLIIPKVKDVECILRICMLIDAAHAPLDLSLIPVVESPGGVLRAEEIAQASGRIIGMITGGEDLSLAMNAEPQSEAIRLSRMLVHLAAKSANIMSLGLFGSIADYRDLSRLSEAVDVARKSGFDGATCIHPSAIPILNRGFSPSAEAMNYAERLLTAVANRASDGAFEFEGRMVDSVHILQARRIVHAATQSASAFMREDAQR